MDDHRYSRTPGGDHHHHHHRPGERGLMVRAEKENMESFVSTSFHTSTILGYKICNNTAVQYETTISVI